MWITSLKEFPLNSRHPGPRREEGGSRAAGHMPLWLDPGGSAGSGGEFQEARFYAQARANRHICSELGVQFSTNLRKSPWAPQGTPRHPQGPPRDPQGIPKGFPRDPKRDPKGPKGSPKGAKWAPKSSQGHPKAIPRATKTSQKDKLYINKLPINRLRGRYVIII